MPILSPIGTLLAISIAKDGPEITAMREVFIYFFKTSVTNKQVPCSIPFEPKQICWSFVI